MARAPGGKGPAKAEGPANQWGSFCWWFARCQSALPTGPRLNAERVKPLAGRVGRQNHEHQQCQGTQERHQFYEHRPAAHVHVVKAPNGQGKGWNDGGQCPDDEQDGAKGGAGARRLRSQAGRAGRSGGACTDDDVQDDADGN